MRPTENALPLASGQGFGPHLMLDCSACNLEKISDVAYVFDVLNRLPDLIGMTKITQPYVFPYSGLVPEDKGVTGLVVIAESHLSFHSFIEKDYFFFDLFSCKPFDVETARQFIVDAFEVKKAETHYVERGLDFPRSEHPAAYALSAGKTLTAINHTLRNEPVPVGV
jgi:S-adenosylmethionine decarboxylase